MEKKSILFVCLGNICRSPSAEAVMKSVVAANTAIYDYFIDSAGIIGVHEGEKADGRMMTHAFERGYRLTSISRQIKLDDFDKFDYIIGMDDSNIRNLRKIVTSTEHLAKIHRMTDFGTNPSISEVPDPYYGGAAGFELVLDILEDSCKGLLESIESGRI